MSLYARFGNPEYGFDPVTVDMLVVFVLILLALVFFATEWFLIDVTAILVMVLEPWIQISLERVFLASPAPLLPQCWPCSF